MRRPKALVFDLDGTIVDSRRDIAVAANATLAAFGRGPLEVERIYPLIGDGSRALVARAFGFLDGQDDARIDDALATFKRVYAEHPCVYTQLMPGAREVLVSGPRCALVTNKPRGITLLVLDALGIGSAFEAVWGGDEGPLKPSPAGVLAVLVRLGVAPADAWVVGDGPQDIGAGKAAGCFTVAVPGIAHRDLVIAAEPDLIVDSLSDVARLANA